MRSFWLIGVGALALVAAGCDGSGGGGDGETDTEGDDREGWFEIGWGEEEWSDLPDGGELRIVWGSQGAAMYPMPLRGSGFTLPDDPSDFTDEDAPIMELILDVEGIDDVFCGHLKCIANYPVAFEVQSDGTYEFVYVPVIVPSELDPYSLEGRSASLRVELTPVDSGTHVQERNLTVTVEQYEPD